MTAFPSPTLPPDVASRLLADWDKTNDELRSLLAVLKQREFTRDEGLQHMRLIRHISVLSTTLHGHQSSALTQDELAWLETQGVLIGCRA
jgi:hypothetical protein